MQRAEQKKYDKIVSSDFVALISVFTRKLGICV